MGDFRRAHDSFLRGFHYLTSGIDRWRLSEIALRLGDTSRQLEDFAGALRWYAAAQRHALSIKSIRLDLDAATGRAMALRGLGRYGHALKIFNQLLRSYRRRRDNEGAAYILWAMGTTERFSGRLAPACRHLRDAVTAYEKRNDASGLAYARCGWGGTLRMMGFADASRQQYALAYRTFRRENDRFGMAYASCGQANGLRMAGHLAEALPFMNRAERGYRALRLSGPLAFVLWSRAQLFIERGNWSAASRELREADRAFRSSRDPRGLVYVALGRAELARARGLDSQAAYLRAAKAAGQLHLLLEKTHARVRAGLAPISLYRPLGVSIKDFSQYRSLP